MFDYKPSFVISSNFFIKDKNTFMRVYDLNILLITSTQSVIILVCDKTKILLLK